jgi:glutathione synthase/RimK-type ligase-like ATP-grasp enzyme
MKTVIYSYNGTRGAGARELRNSLSLALNQEIPIIPERTIKLRGHDVVNLINWGASTFPTHHNWRDDNPNRVFNLLNKPSAVSLAANKLQTFEVFDQEGVPIVDYTRDTNTVYSWLESGGCVVARTLLRAHGGEGIIIIENDEQALPVAPVYTLYKKKKYEYRVHVFKGEVIDIQQKKRERGIAIEGDRAKIRNRANGWVFCREDINIPEADPDQILLKDTSLRAVAALGLDFGAVDIIYNQREGRYYVLEVNTAPGLEGTTLVKYTEAISNWARQQQ